MSHQYWPMSNRYALQPNMMREYHGGRQDECGHYRLSKRTPSAYESWSNTGSRPGWIGQGSAYRIITLQSHTLHVLPLTALSCACYDISVQPPLVYIFTLQLRNGTGLYDTYVQVKFGTQLLEAPEQNSVSRM